MIPQGIVRPAHMPMIDKSVFSSGIRFKCTGGGECCKARGGYAYVYVTLEERQRLAGETRRAGKL